MTAKAAKTRIGRLPANKVLWILLIQAAVVLPHALHLPSWIMVVALTAGIWRFHATRRQWRAPGLLLRVLLIGIGTGAVYASYGSLFGRDAGVAMIVLMLALKLLELNRRRDVVVFVLLGYFVVLTNFLFTQSVFMAAYQIVAGVLLTSALATVQDPGWQVQPARHLRIAAMLMLQAVPVAVLLFLLFPRISGPLWGLPEDAYGAKTGLSEQMSPGSVSRLARSDAVAFRVAFDQQAPPPAAMYWRGPVLDHYDGQTWSGSAERAPMLGGAPMDGPTLSYQVTLEPHGLAWLLALDVPLDAPGQAYVTADFSVRAQSPVHERTRYRLTSRLPSTGLGTTLSDRQRRQALQLPADAEPRTVALGRELAAQYGAPQAIVDAALRRFFDQEYVYTLEPPRLQPHNAVDQFLFQSRRGFCEHYAGAFVVIMRAAGVPARVVTGYQGAELNPNDDYWIVRQSDAHAWAEVWLQRSGWVRIDPTAAIAPERIEQGIEAALPEQARRAGLIRADAPLLRDLDLLWDAVNNRWNQWVLGYGATRQLDFLQQLGFGRPQWFDLALMAAIAVTVALLTLAAWMTFRHRAPRLKPEQRAYARFNSKLDRAGVPRHLQEGPIAFAERVARVRPDLESPVMEIAQLYARIRYGEHYQPGQLRRLKQLVRSFSPGVNDPRGADVPAPSGAGASSR